MFNMILLHKNVITIVIVIIQLMVEYFLIKWD